MVEPLELAALLVAGLLGATLSGVLGMGGGVVLLGTMTAILPARAVVPLHGVVQLTSNFTRTLALREHVVWRVFAFYAPTLVLGVVAAALLWSGDKLTYLRPGVGALLLGFLIYRRLSPKAWNPPMWAYGALGIVVGFASVWIGAIGPLLAPFFLRDDFDNEQVIATKAACQVLGHVLKIPVFFVLGFEFLSYGIELGGLVAVVVVGTLLGRAILHRLEREHFELAFEILLALLAVWLIVGVFV